MEVEGPRPAAPQAGTPRPDDIRQRQLNRLTPRARITKDPRADASLGDGQDASNGPLGLSPAPAANLTGRLSPDASRKRRKPDGMRQENQVATRARGSGGDFRLDITPDGGSAGREGRQFTVANVGNNGRIYLRPTVRPAHQRYPQPPFVFPITPPSTAGFETLVKRNDDETSQRGSLWTAARSPPLTPVRRAADQHFPQARTSPQQQTRHRRAHSYSIVDDHHVPIQDSDFGAIKVVIERPRADGRPKTADELSGAPILEVPIPSYRIGVPRFSTRGTAFIRSSSYSTTDDMRSSVFSQNPYDAPQRDRNSLHPGTMLSRRHSHASPQIQYIRVTPSSQRGSQYLPSPSILPPRCTIEPSMYDTLTFKPACDDRSVVRYSSGGGTITAATPARLVAEITSQAVVDYDLLSDFFLTFRSFLPTSHLLAMLIARLRWALARDDETGMVVRVRTFVAMRHWILNYFMDDFVVDYELRLLFCELLNDFVDEIVQTATNGQSKLKILGELKKCWRRTCALYWDGDDFAAEVGPQIPITPGGVAGSRDPNLTPSFWERPSELGAPQLDSILDQESPTPAGHNFFAEVSRAGHIDSISVQPETPLPVVEGQDALPDPPLSPNSMLSDDITSCSFPTKSKIPQLGGQHPLGVHPVPSSSKYDSSPPVAYTPKAITGKRNRPTHAHKRSGSFSDSLRDERRQPTQTVVYKSTEILMALPYAGSLVRGNLFPPGQAFVEALVPSTPAETMRATGYFNPAATTRKDPSAMSGPGMKKLLGSVRRALSKKAGPIVNASPTQGSFPQIPPLGYRGATVNRLPGTAIVPQERPRNQGRAPLRIDILGAGIAEDFKKAVREDEEADADRRELESHPSIGVASGNEAMYPSMQPDNTLDSERLLPATRPASGLTNGSKSIVIVDDTLPLDLPTMSGALPVNPSTDTFADAYMQPSGGPTPPSTPPEMPLDSPRRSSYLLGQTSFNRNRSLSPERTPSLIRSPSETEQSPSQRPFGRSAMRSYGRSFRSNRSVSLRRYASYQSGFTRHATERSFDATTFSGSGDRASMIEAAPEPLRVLRRRPGGDLRAVANVGDLNTQPLRRPRSTGSLTTYSDSVHSSYLLGRDSSGYVGVVNSDDYSQKNTGTFSLGALAEAPQKQGLSLFSTHSSQPVMRPSFEAEAAKLAQIPDDDDDDGGVESALLKLEGRFEQRRSDISAASLLHGAAPDSPPQSVDAAALEAPLDDAFEDEEKWKHRLKHVVENNLSKTPPLLDSYRPEPPKSPIQALKPSVYQPRKTEVTTRSIGSHDSAGSVSVVPLLEHDDGYPRSARRRSRNWTNSSILRGPSREREKAKNQTPDSSHPSIDFCNVTETESFRQTTRARAVPRHTSRDKSFLDSDSDDGTSLSSEMSIEVISRTEYIGDGSTTTFPPIRSGTVIKEIVLPSHPLRHPSSPSITLGQALSLVPESDNGHEVPLNQIQQQSRKGLPPTPEITPTVTEGVGKRSWERNEQAGPLPVSNKPIEPSRATSVHLPFILAFDSKVLAQQFTLIEKDALIEIDWKELIDMRWKNSSTNPRSWVDFLRTQEARGVEVVIARFNIMVKWAVSECVLTTNLTERVQTIVKYIHVAAHCRRYRNFATLYQLTIALTSTELSRLTKTWAAVPAAERETLRELEALVQPTRNFHALRAEMEGGGGGTGSAGAAAAAAGGQVACVPFVGVYTHDLLFNSQRPSQIASTPTTEPLVNFEKCRTAAAVVKNLLRLLEASALYTFRPVEGVTERCLWMAALGDEEIRKLGGALE